MSILRPAYNPGQYDHFYNRGAHKLSIFREPDNYLFVLADLRGRNLPEDVRLYLQTIEC